MTIVNIIMITMIYMMIMIVMTIMIIMKISSSSSTSSSSHQQLTTMEPELYNQLRGLQKSARELRQVIEVLVVVVVFLLTRGNLCVLVSIIVVVVHMTTILVLFLCRDERKFTFSTTGSSRSSKALPASIHGNKGLGQ